MRSDWPKVAERTGGPALLRRIVQAVGQLPERKHLDEAKKLFDKLKLEEAKQAVAQTLERMELNVGLRERTSKVISTWLKVRETK